MRTGADQREPLNNRLGYQQAIEGMAMPRWQRAHLQHVFGARVERRNGLLEQFGDELMRAAGQ